MYYTFKQMYLYVEKSWDQISGMSHEWRRADQAIHQPINVNEGEPETAILP